MLNIEQEQHHFASDVPKSSTESFLMIHYGFMKKHEITIKHLYIIDKVFVQAKLSDRSLYLLPLKSLSWQHSNLF